MSEREEFVLKGRGRPRKPADAITATQFGVVAKILAIYGRIRAVGHKHSAVVREVVQEIREQNPDIFISETKVKRILAQWRSTESQTVLLFENRGDNLTEDEIAHRAWVRNEIAIRRKVALGLEEVPVSNSKSPVLLIGWGARPNYPRHNRKRDHT
jgi:hypothetical protein